MQTQHSPEQLERALRAWEGWVNEVEGAGNDSPEALGALNASREELLNILRAALLVVPVKESLNSYEQDKAETDRVRCEAGGPLPLDHLPEGSH